MLFARLPGCRTVGSSHTHARARRAGRRLQLASPRHGRASRVRSRKQGGSKHFSPRAGQGARGARQAVCAVAQEPIAGGRFLQTSTDSRLVYRPELTSLKWLRASQAPAAAPSRAQRPTARPTLRRAIVQPTVCVCRVRCNGGSVVILANFRAG